MLISKSITSTNVLGQRCASIYQNIPEVPSLCGLMLFAPRHPKQGLSDTPKGPGCPLRT